MTQLSSEHRCGFVGLMGPTNAGKSTLMNSILQKKVSIVSSKPQTTLRVVRGILTRPDSQVIFVDTPGSTKRKETFARLLNQTAEANAKGCDLLVWVFDAANPNVLDQFEIQKELVSRLKTRHPTLCVFNKIDRVAKAALLPLMERLAASGLFSEIIPISAKSGDGVSILLDRLHCCIPPGPRLYPAEDSTDRSQEFLISEIVREKIYETTGREVPYSVWIEVEYWGHKDSERVPTINVVIHVDTFSRKKILIGKAGAKLKEIGMRARKDVEEMLEQHVCLKIFVHHDKDWRKDTRSVNRYLEVTSP